MVDVNTGTGPRVPNPQSPIQSSGREPWTRTDLTLLGGLAAIAGVAIALGFAGASRIQPIAGLALILALAYCLSSAGRSIDYRTVAWGLSLQFVFALIVLKTDIGRAVFQSAGNVITRVLNFSVIGSDFVFGPLGNPDVWRRMVTTVLGAEGDWRSAWFSHADPRSSPSAA